MYTPKNVCILKKIYVYNVKIHVYNVNVFSLLYCDNQKLLLVFNLQINVFVLICIQMYAINLLCK